MAATGWRVHSARRHHRIPESRRAGQDLHRYRTHRQRTKKFRSMVKFKLTRRQVVRQTAGLLFTLTPIASALAKAAPPAQFVAARIWPSHAYTRITIESSRALQYQHFALENPTIIAINITINKKLVPHLGCNVVNFFAFSGVSSRPFS